MISEILRFSLKLTMNLRECTGVAGGFLVAIGGRKLVRPACLRENRRKFSSQS